MSAPGARAAIPAPRGAAEPLSAAALLDALPDAAALVDADGRITAVNRVWRIFAADNDGRPEDTCEGADYLAVCDRAAAAGSSDAAEVAAGLRAVLGGEAVERDLEYPCPSTADDRWFIVRITAVPGTQPVALVTHVNITRRKAAEAELLQRATLDPLTGLANRLLLMSELRQALTPRAGRAGTADVGVLCVDLDDFKPVNDRFGHDAGDDVLRQVARRLRDAVRPQDTVARLGGDEFVVIAPRIDAARLTALADRVQAALAEAHHVRGQSLRAGASVGWCLAAPGEEAAAVLRRADEAMYAAKRGKRSQR